MLISREMNKKLRDVIFSFAVDGMLIEEAIDSSIERFQKQREALKEKYKKNETELHNLLNQIEDKIKRQRLKTLAYNLMVMGRELGRMKLERALLSELEEAWANYEQFESRIWAYIDSFTDWKTV